MSGTLQTDAALQKDEPKDRLNLAVSINLQTCCLAVCIFLTMYAISRIAAHAMNRCLVCVLPLTPQSAEDRARFSLHSYRALHTTCTPPACCPPHFSGLSASEDKGGRLEDHNNCTRAADSYERASATRSSGMTVILHIGSSALNHHQPPTPIYRLASA